MGLPAALKPLLASRKFWTDFLWITEDDYSEMEARYAVVEDLAVRFPIGTDATLALRLGSALGYFGLQLCTEHGERESGEQEIGWDDQAHWHPHVLRWEELDLFARAMAIRDADFPHPGVAVLLLHRFAPICVEDNVPYITSLMEAAWGRYTDFTHREVMARVEAIDARKATFSWRFNEAIRGWTLQQTDDSDGRGLYSLRYPEAQFPFSDWDRLLAEASAIVSSLRGAAVESAERFAEGGGPDAIAQLKADLNAAGFETLACSLNPNSNAEASWICEAILGAEPGAILLRRAGSELEIRETHHIELTYPYLDTDRPRATPSSYVLTCLLDHLLQDRQLGECEVSGGMGQEDEDGNVVEVNSSMSVTIKGPRDVGVGMVRQALWWFDAPASVELCRDYTEEIPLHLDLAPPEGSWNHPIQLQVGRYAAEKWGDASAGDYRLDEAPIRPEQLAVIQSVLRDANASHADQDGWRTITCEDGGRLRWFLPRYEAGDEPLDHASVEIMQLSEECTAILWRVLVSGLVLMPLRVAAVPEGFADLNDLPWPRFRLLDQQSELHAILAAGPYGWWKSDLGP